jgi:hypothetical protein
MKIVFSLLLIITFASHFGTNAVFAQKRAKPKEVIILEVLLPNQESFSKAEIPINDTLKGNLDASGGVINECGIPEDPECAKTVYAYYGFRAKAFASGKSKTQINLQFEVTYGNEDCKMQEKNFIVYRNRQTKITLECGFTLIARYGLEGKEANLNF